MAALTRTELESWKRPALQQKCKELGIKANGKTESLIELIAAHYETEEESHQPGSSKPSTSKKRKAPTTIDTHLNGDDPANSGDEDPASGDAVISAAQRASTRRKPAHSSAPPAKLRRVGTKSRVKTEPSAGDVAQPSLRPGHIMEVVLNSPRISGKGKAKELPAKSRQTEEPEEDEEGSASGSRPVQGAKRVIPAAKALQALKTATTDIEIDSNLNPSLESQLTIDETRITDLELQLRNARKFNDEAGRDILALYSFQHAVQQAFGDTDTQNTTDSMKELAKLRDIAPKLTALSTIDIEAIVSRTKIAEEKTVVLEATLQDNQSVIAELKERIRELEEGKSAVGDLEVLVRQLQSQINALPAAQSQNNTSDDSGTERMYTINRGASYDGTAAPSSSQARPLSRLSVPPEENLRPQNQDQNKGRASSVNKGLRIIRPPLAEKEGIRVGQPDVEVETADPRRSIRRLAESSSVSAGNSAPPSRGRSTTPSQREPSSGNPTPSQGKGKGKLMKRSASALDTVEEDGDSDVFEADLGTPEVTGLISTIPIPTPTSTVDAIEPAEPERLPSPPPVPNPFSPDTHAPGSPARFFEVGQDNTSGSPPATESKPDSQGQANRGATLSHNLLPLSASTTIGESTPIPELPFKLIASPLKPIESSSQTSSRSSAPTGRVPKAPRNSHQPYSRPAPARKATSESVGSAPTEAAGVFNFALPGPSSSAPLATAGGSTPSRVPSLLETPAAFVTPERLESNFSLFPSARLEFGQTPGGLAFKTTGRAAPGTPAATTTLFGTEVARDTRFADLPYDPDTSRGNLSWEEPTGAGLWPGQVPRNTTS